jgi:uncharacterized protein with ParB-like and HNH nuclease domain
MKGEAKPLIKFLDGSDNRFIIPVYQRNYDWTQKQCKQLFDDLVSVINNKSKSHFFGSLVSTHQSGAKASYLIIDGQQRITTVSLIFIAMINLMKKGDATAENESLSAKIEETYVIDKFSKNSRKLRLKPIKDDCVAFDNLVKGDESNFIKESNITSNYQYFCTRILNKEITLDELYEAISRLEIIDIFVEDDENPQLIFESLNSTGLDLTEADKIRNFILMGLDTATQEDYYEHYWNKIEKLTGYMVSEFIRHYLTVKQRIIPNISKVYDVFKEYINKIATEDKVVQYGKVLADMLFYAEITNKIFESKTGLQEADRILKRLNFIDLTVAYPFFLNLFSHFENNEITPKDVLCSLECIESFVIRRIVCPGFATNALNKIFCTLDYDIMKVKKNDQTYSSALIYILEHKNGSAGFPTDTEFKTALTIRDIYSMHKKNKEYLFDRLENTDSVEHVNVIGLMETKTLTIEHIMPQTLTEEWKKVLGKDWKEVYEKRCNTLANLTLTGYNGKYSNHSFEFKKTCDKGFKNSALNISKQLLDFDKWTNEEMDLRNNSLVNLALKLWPYPDTDFVPASTILDQVSLEDADDLTGRKLVSYTFGDSDEHKVMEWVTMFTKIASLLYAEDSAPMNRLAGKDTCNDLRFYDKRPDNGWYKIAEDLYLYKATSTSQKLYDLNKIFEEYGKDKSDLVFNLMPLKVEA